MVKQYISKSAIVAEIERIRGNADRRGAIGKVTAKVICDEILSFLDDLEVREVDLEKEISQFINANFEKAKIGHKLSLRRTAKHFFELGLSASNESQKGGNES